MIFFLLMKNADIIEQNIENLTLSCGIVLVEISKKGSCNVSDFFKMEHLDFVNSKQDLFLNLLPLY